MNEGKGKTPTQFSGKDCLTGSSDEGKRRWVADLGRRLEIQDLSGKKGIFTPGPLEKKKKGALWGTQSIEPRLQKEGRGEPLAGSYAD